MTAKYCQKGQMYICKETEYNPECIIFHPDDFEDVKISTKERTLVHIKDEPEKDQQKRLLKNLKIYCDELIEKEMDEFEYRPTYLNYSYYNNYFNKGES